MAESNVCSSCGAQLPEDAAFCGNCGAKAANETACEVSSETNPLKKLLYVIWTSIGIGALSSLIGIFDVREYYGCGQFWSAVSGVIEIVLSAWLALEIGRRKNWARVTFTIFNLLAVTMYLYEIAFAPRGGNALVLLLNLTGVSLTVYCIVMLFTKKVSGVFLSSKNGRKLACAFWGAFLGFFVLSCICGVWRCSSEENREEYLTDCAMAAAKGSNEAYESLVEYCVATSETTGTNDEIRQAAEEMASAIIAEVCSDAEEAQPAKPLKRAEKPGGFFSGIGKYASAKMIVLLVLGILGVVLSCLRKD